MAMRRVVAICGNSLVIFGSYSVELFWSFTPSDAAWHERLCGDPMVTAPAQPYGTWRKSVNACPMALAVMSSTRPATLLIRSVETVRG